MDIFATWAIERLEAVGRALRAVAIWAGLLVYFVLAVLLYGFQWLTGRLRDV
jgi:hypothetical protein